MNLSMKANRIQNESPRIKRLTFALGLSGSVLAMATFLSAWMAQVYWPYEARFWVVNAWVARLLWISVALVSGASLIALFSNRGDISRGRKIFISILTAAIITVGLLGLDFGPGVPAGQNYGRYTFSEDGTTGNAKSWENALAHLRDKPGVRALEVGTYEGRSAIWFLENILTDRTSSITCIDLFDGPFEMTFDRNVSYFGAKVKKIRAPSQIGLRGLKPWSYDFAYIDGSHVAKDVIIDTMLTWDLVKPGGVIIFDDYEWAGLNERLSGEAFKPRIAIDAFLRVMEPYIEVVHKGYQVIVRKRTEINSKSAQTEPRNNP
jgi:predicted O-methyltransferase YrrM